MSDPPLVSVLIPTLRRPRRLWQALASVGAQTYPHVEAVVVNDAGADVSTVVARYESTFGRPARYIAHSENRGLSATRNTAAAAASGSLLALLDDDDRYLPDHLARLVPLLTGNPQAALAYDDVLILAEEGEDDAEAPQTVAVCRFGRPYDAAVFERDDFIVPSATLIRREAYESIGGFDEKLRVSEDWDFLLRLREQGALCYDGSAVGVLYSQRTNPAGRSGNQGSWFDESRRAALDYLSARYDLPPIAPKTFLDVAREMGFPLVPIAEASEDVRRALAPPASN
jgi:glycosyltransferase involved in cell wall biosynthesis